MKIFASVFAIALSTSAFADHHETAPEMMWNCTAHNMDFSSHFQYSVYNDGSVDLELWEGEMLLDSATLVAGEEAGRYEGRLETADSNIRAFTNADSGTGHIFYDSQYFIGHCLAGM